MTLTNFNNLSFYKNHLIKRFSKILKTEGLEMRIINNKIIVSFWCSNQKRISNFIYELPNGIFADFVVNKRNQISGVCFYFKGDNYKIALTKIKLLYNKVIGVIKSYENIIEIFGTGFRFTKMSDPVSKQDILEIYAGFNKSKKILIPINVYLTNIENNYIKICSCDKNALTMFSSKIRGIKPLNRYKLRGIKFKNDKFTAKIYKKNK